MRNTQVSLAVAVCLLGMTSILSNLKADVSPPQRDTFSCSSSAVSIIPMGMSSPKAGTVFKVMIVGSPDLDWDYSISGSGGSDSGVSTTSGVIIEIPVGPNTTGENLVFTLRSLSGGGTAMSQWTIQP